MMKNSMSFMFCMVLLFSAITPGRAQNSPCTANTPHFTIDLSGDPGGSFTIPLMARQGLCCDAQSPEACIMATILLDSNAVGIRFSIASGAVPPGALYYQIGCGSPTQVGEQICLDGPGPHILTFCKPGKNQNSYEITSIPKSIIPDEVDVVVGCSKEIGTLGYFVDTSLRWTDLSSSDGRYLDYLDCTVGCDTVTVTPDENAPSQITYQVCGMLIDTVCSDLPAYLCREVTVNVSKISANESAAICQGDVHLLPDGSIVDTAGTYVVTIPSSTGCDSVITTALTVNPTYQIQREMTVCEGTVIHGNWYAATQIVEDRFQTVNGCDSIIYTDLTVNYGDTTYVVEEHCDNAMIRGRLYGTSQVITTVLSNQNGCDSVIYTDLVINRKAQTNEEVRACDSVRVKGYLYTASNLRVDSLLTHKGCDSVHLTDIQVSYSTSTALYTSICEGEWYTLPDFSTVAESGTYSTILQTSAGCDSTVTVTLDVQATGYEPVADTSKCRGDVIQIAAGGGLDLIDYRWSNGDRGPVTQVMDLGTLYLTVESGNGCISKDTIAVEDAHCPACPVYTPNAFTPNQTGLHEDFTPVHQCDMVDYQFEIYNRWGEKLFESQLPGERWDATYMGEKVQQDVYVWILRYKDQKALLPIKQRGTVSVIY